MNGTDGAIPKTGFQRICRTLPTTHFGEIAGGQVRCHINSECVAGLKSILNGGSLLEREAFIRSGL
jgi:hypothetical protein